MTSVLDEDDLALSINPSHTRRGSARSPSEQGQQHDPMQHAAAAQARQSSSTQISAQNRNNRLGQYNIVKTLGEGSFGKVKLAIHAVSKQRVALKIISRKKLVQRDMAGRVEREIQYLQLLRHPHIIKLYTVISTATEIIMVLEYAGSELFNYIVENGRMVEDKARLFFQQIVCAVEYCHRHKIVHRDLKPENLLLDENLHVKIADFGLSNIMSDGNFLKTSCGSPNYAAPEVISGKLYAGPEVDVWSCGVILYVLLVGRLPFDDEYIPSLFKKIASGNYQVPPYLSPGAQRIIKKMLQVSPVSRISIQEIRQDPWFMKGLPEYLQPPVEEFLDTGVDPSKPIDPRNLAPTKSTEVVEKLHNSVVGKLGKTMGYGREDVQQALAVDEPNAIKDAYLIVRENQLMRDTASMARDPSLQPFLAQSPPVNAQSPIASGQVGGQTLAQNARAQIHNQPHASSPLRDQNIQQSQTQQSQSRGARRDSITMTSLTEVRSPGGSNIAVLPSSLPDYHRAFMAGQPKASQKPSNPDDDGSNRQNDPADASARARRLNPHSRSQMNLDRLNKPEGMTPLRAPGKRTKPMKWQFGIRSKNHAAEAMLAIYRALKAMGADWEVPKMRKPGLVGGSEGSESPEASRGEGGGHSGSEVESDYAHSASDEDEEKKKKKMKKKLKEALNPRGRSPYQYGSWNDWGYHVPEDPWIINARFRKGEMLPPGILHAYSANNSRVDLNMEPNGGGGVAAPAPPAATSAAVATDSTTVPRRRSSALSSSGSAGGEIASSSPGGSGSNFNTQVNSASPSNAIVNPTPPITSSVSAGDPNTAQPSEASANTASAQQAISNPTSLAGSGAISSISLASTGNDGRSSRGSMLADDSAYVYLTIQLYAIEKDTYLVDFKCAGYERVVRRLAREIQEHSDVVLEEKRPRAHGSNTGSDDDDDDDDDDPDNANDKDDSSSSSSSSEISASRTNSLDKFNSGRPREGGNWDAMRARRASRDTSPISPGTAPDATAAATAPGSAIDRTDYAPGAEAATTAAPPPSPTSAPQPGSGRDGNGNMETTKAPTYHLKEDLLPRGRAAEEKDVSSPFPFLDVASRLIIQLARAD